MKYPKLRKRSTPEACCGVQEPIRKTLFDRIQDNFKEINRVTYMHRVIYIGEHDMPESLATKISETMEIADEHCTRERLTGFLVIYHKHFIHMIEGDEDMIHYHIKELFAVQDQNPKKLTNLKLVLQVSHILKRLCPACFTHEGTPSQLLTALEVNTIEDTARQVYNCVRKVYALVQQYMKNLLCIDPENVSICKPDVRPSGGSGSGSRSLSSNKNTSFQYVESSTLSLTRASLIAVRDPYRAYLPERELLEALLESKLTMTLRKYHLLYAYVPQRDIYKDKVWPVPGDFIPFDVFSAPYDMVTELPKPESSNQKHEDETSLDEVSSDGEAAQEETKS